MLNLWEEKQFLAATCGTIINNEYILWAEWKNGDLFKMNLDNYKIEFVGSPTIFGHNGKAFSRMIKSEEKVYLIGFLDAYEIIEYDIQSNRMRLLYQKIVKGIQVFYAFLIGSQIYMFPSTLEGNICIYSIKENRVDYIKYTDLISEADYKLKNNFAILDEYAGKIVGAFYNTPCIFVLETTPQIQCKIYRLEENHKIADISIIEEKLYITLMNQNIVLCMDQGSKIDEVYYSVSENGQFCNKGTYIMPLIVNDNIFLFPFEENNEIQCINRRTEEQSILQYPEGFHKRQEGRFFWETIVFGNQLFLLPHGGNKMLIIDTISNHVKCVEWVETNLNTFLKIVIPSKIQKISTRKTGSNIYYTINK